jgi:hypothetical protein
LAVLTGEQDPSAVAHVDQLSSEADIDLEEGAGRSDAPGRAPAGVLLSGAPFDQIHVAEVPVPDRGVAVSAVQVDVKGVGRERIRRGAGTPFSLAMKRTGRPFT